MYINLNVFKYMTDVKLLLLHSNTWNNLTVDTKQKEIKLVLKFYLQNVFTNQKYLIYQ